MALRLTAGLTLAVVVSLAGCAGSNVARPPDDNLVLGRTTRQEIVQRLGSPYREGSLTKNGKQLKTMSYEFAMTGGTPAREGITPSRGQGFYFLDDKLAGYDFNSSWKEDHSDFDATKVPQIKKGASTRADVVKMIGPARGKYAYPMIPNQNQQADVYLYAETKGSPFNAKFYQKHLVVTYDERGFVSNVEYREAGQK